MDQAKKARPWALRVWSREAVLLTALASLGIMFGVTEAAVGFYRTKQSQLAQMWFQRGTSALAAQKPKEAIQDFRNALNYAPNNSTYQLRLAQAFAAANQIDAAESYLFDLWSRQPGSGEINLELAQLEARRGNPDAARYFDNAIYGVWESHPEEHRWQARMQLFQFYRSVGNTGQAQAELLAMAADTPLTDYRRQTQIGRLQLEAGVVAVEREMLSGNAIAREMVLRRPAVVALMPGFSAPAISPTAPRVEQVPVAGVSALTERVELRPKPSGGVHLETAERIVTVGRGLQKKEDLALIEALATELGASVGCTRPLAAEAGWLSDDHWIGLTGHRVKPRLYVAIGVSGAVQHLVGMRDSRTVVAINKDPNAPIFGQADYRVTADLYAVVPALTKVLGAK